MKKILLILLAISLMFGVATLLSSKPKYIYAVRENINPEINSIEWDLWCWREFSNGVIDKKFVGHFEMQGTNDNPDRIQTSLCR